MRRLAYECSPPLAAVDTLQRPSDCIATRYPSLALPDELAGVTACWVHTLGWTTQRLGGSAERRLFGLPVHSTVEFLIDREPSAADTPPLGAASEAAVANSPSGLDFSVRVLMLQGVDRSACALTAEGLAAASVEGAASVEAGGAKSHVGRGRHLPVELRAVVSVEGRGQPFLPGGRYDPAADGGDPLCEDECLVRAATRLVKAQTGLDLSPCRQWAKVLTASWQRVAPSGGGRELTVVFLVEDMEAAATAPAQIKDEAAGAAEAAVEGQPDAVRLRAPASSDAGGFMLKHKLMSLRGLLDYDESDLGEPQAVTCLAAEALYECLQRGAAETIARAIRALECKPKASGAVATAGADDEMAVDALFEAPPDERDASAGPRAPAAVDALLAFRMLDASGVGWVAAQDLEMLLLHGGLGLSPAGARSLVAAALQLGALADGPQAATGPHEQVRYVRLVDELLP
jgi:hypothetical protein